MAGRQHRVVILDLIDAWESLPGGQRYTMREVGDWLEKTMAPAFDRARRDLGMTIPTKRQRRELPWDQ